MKFNSVRVKISLFYTAILAVIMVIYSAVMFINLRYFLHRELDDTLLIKSELIANAIHARLEILGENRKALISAVKSAIYYEEKHEYDDAAAAAERKWLREARKMGIDKDVITFSGAGGRSFVISNNLRNGVFNLLPSERRILQARGAVFGSKKIGEDGFRVVTIPFFLKGKAAYLIQIGASLTPVRNILRHRLAIMALTIPVFMLCSVFIGRWIAMRILNPVMEMTTTARNITYEDLSARISTEHIDEEMRYLADAFNNMLSRLERSFKHITEFSSHAAHELKTPLAIMRGESELALRKERDREEYKRVIRVNMQEIQRMLRIIQDLLLLTRLDYQPGTGKFDRIDLTGLLREVSGQIKVLASEKNISANAHIGDREMIINGNRTQLRRLFLNLLDNARKFTPPGGEIDIAAERKDNRAVVTISDTGTGIAGDDLPNIFDRFFHKDKETEEKGVEPGTGLGLSIVRSITKIHRGDIRVRSQSGKGSAFILTLPLLKT